MLQEITNIFQPINSFVLSNAPIIGIIIAIYAIACLWSIANSSDYSRSLSKINDKLERIAVALEKLSKDSESKE